MPKQHSLPSSTTRVLRSQAALIRTLKYQARPRPRRRPIHLDPWTPKRKRNPNPKPRPRRIGPSHSTCRICIEYQPAANFIPWSPPKRYYNYDTPEVPRTCVPHLTPHPTQRDLDPICKTCIGANMSARLDMYGARKVNIGCLEPQCKTHWDSDQVLRYFPTGAPLDKYSTAMLDVWKSENSTQILMCISDSCDAIGIKDSAAPGYPHVSCSTCELRMCATCMVPWHAGLTCAEFGARHINAAMTDAEKETLEMLQQKDGKRCPNCHIVIEKDGGCDSMYCACCKTYFSWSTAASAVPGSRKALPVFGGLSTVCELDGLSMQVSGGTLPGI